MRDTKKYMSLPYNPALKERARELRKAGNLSEVLLWNQLKNMQLFGLDIDVKTNLSGVMLLLQRHPALWE